MRVVFCNRPDWQERSGGDVVQMLQTKKALETEFKVDVHIAESPADPAIAQADLVHVFNVQDPDNGLPYLHAAQAAGRPTALSPVFWDLSHAWYVSTLARMKLYQPRAVWRLGKPLFDAVSSASALISGRPRYYSPAYRAHVREMIGLADVVLPNSDEEGRQLARYIRQPLGEARTVVNALDLSIFAPGKGERTGIVMAARIEPIKNTMGVLAATESLASVPMTLVGRITEDGYGGAVRKQVAKRSNVTLLDQGVPHGELASIYQGAAVHVLPSFRESPGLSTLEALSCGCKVVVSHADYCPVDTYFRDLVNQAVFTCDPYDPASILSAIQGALESSLPYELDLWRAKFSWNEAARQTFDAYRQVVPS